MLTTKFSPLPHLGLDLSPEGKNDPRIVFYNILTNCMTICVLQTASVVATQGNVSAESQSQCLKLQYDAAEMIVAIMRSEVDLKGVMIVSIQFHEGIVRSLTQVSHTVQQLSALLSLCRSLSIRKVARSFTK